MANPRFDGIQEHLSRATFLLEVSRQASDLVGTYRLQLAAVYSCRAVVELMLEAAEKKELKNPSDPNAHWSRKELEDYVTPKLTFYALVEKIRIHDFHRFGLLPPNPNVQEGFLGGPIKLVAQKGAASISFGKNGPIRLTTGNSQVKEQRPLFSLDGKFFDDDSLTYVALDVALGQFINSAHSVVAEVTANAA